MPSQTVQIPVPFKDSVYTPVEHVIPTGGVAPDLTVDSLGDRYLASGLNFVVRDGRVRKREGSGGTFLPGPTSGASVLTVKHFYEYVMYSGATRLVTVRPDVGAFYLNTGALTWTAIQATALAGAGNSPVFFAPMRTASSGLRLIFTTENAASPLDPPQWWSGDVTSTFTVLSTAVIGTCCITWRSHFLQGNTQDTADGKVACRVHWSALGDPTVWTGTASAGSIDLIDANATRVMCFLPLQQQLIAYKEEGCHVLTYKASPFYFTQQLLHASITPLGPTSVCPINGGNQHFVLTREGAIIWDGQTIQTVGRDRVDRTLLSNCLLTQPINDTVCFWNPFRREVLITLLYTSSSLAGAYANRLWVYNLQYDSWWESDQCLLGFGSLYRTFSSGQAKVIAVNNGPGTGVIYDLFRSSNTKDGTASAAVSASLQTGYYDFGSQLNKGIDRVSVVGMPFSTDVVSSHSTSLQFIFTSAANPVFPNNFSGATYSTIPLTTGDAALPVLDARTTNRWISYRLTHTGNESVEIHSIIPRVVERSDTRVSRG